MTLDADEFIRRFLLHALPDRSIAFATTAFVPMPPSTAGDRDTRFMIGFCCSCTFKGYPTRASASAGSMTYFQYLTGEEFFQHAFPHERSDLSRWRKRLGDKLAAAGREPAGGARRRRLAQQRPQAGHGVDT